MNAILKPNFKKNKINNIEDSSSEEDPKIKDMEQTLAQTLEKIEKNIKIFPEMPQRGHRDRFKHKVQNFEIGMR